MAVICVKSFDSRFYECFKALTEQTVPVENIYICSESKYGSDQIEKMRGNMKTPEGVYWLNIVEAYNRCRQVFMKLKNFDMMLTVESDIVAPKDAIEKLLEGMAKFNLDMIGGIYRLRHNGNICAWKEYNNELAHGGEKFP
jgi:hypothetical protein